MKDFIKKHILYHISPLHIPSVTRISLQSELSKHFKDLKPGIVLDVGSKHSPYKKSIPNIKYLRLDIDEKTNPDICCDLHKIKWQENYFDIIIATEVLEHLHDPRIAIKEIHRILKKGGTCLFSTRFIYPYHPDPKDYYRFTKDSLSELLKDFSIIKIYNHGNRIQVLWQIINYGRFVNFFLNIFNPIIAKINYKEEKIPLGFVIKAQK